MSRQPSRARCQAMLLPTMPAPMTTTRARSGSALMPTGILLTPGPSVDGPEDRWSRPARGCRAVVPRPPGATRAADRSGPRDRLDARRSGGPILLRPHPRDTVPSLFIDGQWVASADGACSPVVNPSDGTLVTEVDVATDEPGPGGDRRRPAGLRPDRLAADPDRRARRPCSTGSPGSSTATSRRWPARRPSTPARRCARAAGTCPTSRASSATTPTWPTRRPAGWSTTSNPERDQPDRLRAGRRVRAHRAVELPAPADELEDRPGARRRQHGGHEAGPAHAALDDPPDPPARGGRPARRASSTSCSARDRGSARRSPTARTSTSSR